MSKQRKFFLAVTAAAVLSCPFLASADEYSNYEEGASEQTGVKEEKIKPPFLWKVFADTVTFFTGRSLGQDITEWKTWSERGEFDEFGFAQARRGNLTGLINTKGEWIAEPNYHEIRPFSDGLAAAKIANNNKWGYINMQGETVIPFKYEGAVSFSEGAGAVVYYETWDDSDLLEGPRMISGLRRLWAFIDKEGNLYPFPDDVVPVLYGRYSDIQNPRLIEGMFPVVDKNDLKGFLNRYGKRIIESRYEFVWPFSEGCARVMTSVGGELIRICK